MSYESRAYDKPNNDGFPPDPVVVLVVEGTHDVSRLMYMLAGGQSTIEQQRLAKYILRQVRRQNAGRAALRLLAKHGGPDLLGPVPTEEPELRDLVAEAMYDANVEPGAWANLARTFQSHIVERTHRTYRRAADAAIQVLRSER